MKKVRKLKKGDTVAVLESMKMEFPIESEYSGVIEKVFIKTSQQVDAGQMIAAVKRRNKNEVFPKKLSLKWINQAYDNNELTPYELVDEILKRAEENKDKNIWIVAPSESLWKSISQNFRREVRIKPLWGIPFAIKDNIDLEGVPTTAACPEYSYMPKKKCVCGTEVN